MRERERERELVNTLTMAVLKLVRGNNKQTQDDSFSTTNNNAEDETAARHAAIEGDEHLMVGDHSPTPRSPWFMARKSKGTQRKLSPKKSYLAKRGDMPETKERKESILNSLDKATACTTDTPANAVSPPSSRGASPLNHQKRKISLFRRKKKK